MKLQSTKVYRVYPSCCMYIHSPLLEMSRERAVSTFLVSVPQNRIEWVELRQRIFSLTTLMTLIVVIVIQTLSCKNKTLFTLCYDSERVGMMNGHRFDNLFDRKLGNTQTAQHRIFNKRIDRVIVT